MKLDSSELGLYVYQRHQDLIAAREPWIPWWNELAMYVMPRYQNIGQGNQIRPMDPAVLFDGTAVQANMILANGQLDWMTPHSSRWFTFDPPSNMRGVDIVEQWFKLCSEIAALSLARSNFYSAIHQVYLDRGGFGTAVLHVEAGRTQLLNFSKYPIGTYAIAENDEHFVDTLSREFDLTTRQAMQWFGRESLSEEIVKAFDDKSAKQREKTFCRVSLLA